MKVAVLIDFLETKGGGEKIAYYIAKRYNADIYTGSVSFDKILPEFKEFSVKVLGKMPSSMLLKPETLLRKFRALDLSGYDVIICLGAGYSYFTAEKNHPVIWYSFGISPLFYSAGPETQKYWQLGKARYRPVVWLWRKRMQGYDRRTMHQHVDEIIAPSRFTGKILKKYYGRDYTLISPPIEMSRFYNRKSKGYYLIVSRLVPEKRVDLAVEAFRKMPDKTLFVEGTGPEEKRLKELAAGAKNIRFLGRISTKELDRLYSECIALINVAYYQDINMVMMEALASGKPCISVRQGAFGEFIKDGKNGVLIDDTVDGVVEGVARLTANRADAMKKECMKSAQALDIANFYKKLDRVIERVSRKRQ